MRINHNISALNAWRGLTQTDTYLGKSLEKLSSGLRINRAGDDAAGLAISEKMRGQIRGLNQAVRNSQDGISLIQTSEGALAETHSILNRMRELLIQANNGTYKAEDVEKIQEEITQLSNEITGIAERTQFNKQNLLDGTLGAATANVGTALDGDVTSVFKILDVTGAKIGAGYTVTTDDGTNDTITLTNADGSLQQTVTVADVTSMTVGTNIYFDKIGVTLETTATDVSSLAANNTFDVTANGISFQIGANTNQVLSVSINDMSADQLGSVAIKMNDIDATDFVTNSFNDQLTAIDEAISTVSSERSKLGAWQNRLEHTIVNLNTAAENLTAAESRIRDVDMAAEMMEFTKLNILAQAGTAMMAQANMRPQSVLQLLQ